MDDLDLAASIKRFYDAENKYCGDPDGPNVERMLDELDPDVIVEVPDSLPHGGTWRGRAGFADLFAAVGKHWDKFEVVYDEQKWHQIDDERVLIEGTLRGVLSATGNKIEMPFVSLFTFTSRGASRLVHYYKDTAAIVAAAR